MVFAGLAVGTRAPPVDVARKPRYVDARGPAATPIARAGGGSPLRRRRKNTPARYIGDTSELWKKRGGAVGSGTHRRRRWEGRWR